MQSGRQQGFVYVGVLIGLAVVGIGLSAVSQVWYQSSQREKEQQLLFVGHEFRQAITRFYQASPPNARRFPMTLDELMQDDRVPEKSQHYLRRMYPDPMTGKPDWQEVRLPSGQIVGVQSRSDEAPIKTADFRLRDRDLTDKQRYSEWIFRSALPAANPIIRPDGSYSSGGGAGTGASGGAAGARPPGAAPAPPERAPTPTPPGVILPQPRRR
jgi:type II secretory pathway pseudopilin PulG